jgi:hypothetical protein
VLAKHAFKMKAATKAFAGGIAVIDAGYVAPATTATGLLCYGRFEADVDNSGGAAGDKTAEVLSGCFKYLACVGWLNPSSATCPTVVRPGAEAEAQHLDEPSGERITVLQTECSPS